MDKIALLKEQIKLIKDLIGKSEDEAELKGYQAQIDGLNIEIGKEEAKAEAEEKAVKVAEENEKNVREAARKGLEVKTPRVEVGTPDNYMGKYNLKRIMAHAEVDSKVNTTVKNAIKTRPEQAEGVVKHFVDLYDHAITTVPGTPKAVKAAMQEGTDSEGGYITPTEQRAELLSYIREQSVTMPDVNHIAMSSDVMTIPAELAKVGVAWTAEESDATQSDATFSQVTLTAKRLDAVSVASNELIEDTNIPGGVVGMLLSQFTEAIALEIDNQVLTGTGSPVSGVFTAQAGYSEVFESGSTALRC